MDIEVLLNASGELPLDNKKLGALMGTIAANAVPSMQGVDFFFCRFFPTEDMDWDFDRIEEDFMVHCFDKLRDFSQDWFEHTEVRYSTPENSHKFMVMGLMLNGAKSGDEYCKGLIRYLFKTYYKPLYNQLKRFRSISFEEVLSMAKYAGEALTVEFLAICSILLTMCSIDGIEIQKDVSLIYCALNSAYEGILQIDDESVACLELEEGLFESCSEKVFGWLDECGKTSRDFKKTLKPYHKGEKFIAACLRYFGYAEDYLYNCTLDDEGLETHFTKTLAILKTTFPKEEFSFEEVQKYALLYGAILSALDVSEYYEDVCRGLLGISPSIEEIYEGTLFHPENIVVQNAPVVKKEKPLTTIAPVERGDVNEEEYLAEIDRLRKALSQKERECRELKGQLASANSYKKETEQLIHKHEGEREELIALREFAYRLEQAVPEHQSVSIDDMKKCIAEKSYVVIGGHINWVNKLKKDFPKWTFILPSDYRTVDHSGLINKDRIFFFTDYLSHAAYNKFIAVARDRRVPFSYLHGINMEQIIRQIYECETL